MKKIIILLVLILAIVAIALFWRRNSAPKPNPAVSNSAGGLPPAASSPSVGGQNPVVPDTADFQPPLSRAGERVTKKPFGIYITPQTSPVQPEKFRGYHTGADFEIFPEELNAEVPIHAVCSGSLKVKEYATGYGGVAVQSCLLDNSPIAVIYGHLKLASITFNVGENIKTGDTIGILGAAYSPETNGERKHLHLGFHKGSAVNILGYVQNKTELSGWIDPCLYICY